MNHSNHKDTKGTKTARTLLESFCFGRGTEMGRSRQRGFSLLELVIALVVIGFAVAVSYPALSRGAAALHLRATGRDILNTLRYAREIAITQQVGSRVVVDRNLQKVILTDQYGEGGRTYTLSPDVRIQRLAAGTEEIMNGPLIIRFLPNGSSDSAEILLQSETGTTMRIVTDPITGGARILTDQPGRPQ